MGRRGLSALFAFWLFLIPSFGMGSTCSGHFVNPISDICWDCLFPITIGDMPVVSGDYPDTPNPGNPLCLCPTGVLYRLGMTIGYWEPFALVDVTRKPYCMVNLGMQMHMKEKDTQGLGGSAMPSSVGRNAFYYVHWYKYPVVYWLQILTSMACLEGGDMDIAYLTELDPTWNDSELAFSINPEASLFTTPLVRMACAADATKSLYSTAIDGLFWCQGSQGSTYPLSGHVSFQTSPLQAATLLAERMDFKMHREGLVKDSIGSGSPGVCYSYPSPILPKSRYRYQLTNTLPDAASCHPFGQSTTLWETGHMYPGDGDNFGFMIWRKRNCCFL